MSFLSRREFLYVGLTSSAAASAVTSRGFAGADAEPQHDVHRQLLELAARDESERRARFAAVKTLPELEALQSQLRATFLELLDGLPEKQPTPPVTITGRIEGDDYVVDKLVYESFPGYFVSALLYQPRKIKGQLPGVISPCGHSTTGKAADIYQMLHINLAKRGYVVLTYDPVGQGERSQFWDTDKKTSRFGLGCNEHGVLGNPLYLLGSSLARYMIWDAMRGVDYLTSLKQVDPSRIGCVGVSGGGTLTAYLGVSIPRITAAAICCYITTLPRRMGNRIEADPDADPEQDIFGFVSGGIDHAGLLRRAALRPTFLGLAIQDFFPIEGARASFVEAKRIYEAVGAGDRIERFEINARHSLLQPMREAIYDWFDRWLAGKKDQPKAQEVALVPRKPVEIEVAAGQVNVTFKSRQLLPLALEDFQKKPKAARIALKDLLRLDPDAADPSIINASALTKKGQTLFVCINGNESAIWQEEKEFLQALVKQGAAVAVVDPRGVASQRPERVVKGHDYMDPLVGVEENIAYNAFLLGKSLLGMRVADVLAALDKLTVQTKSQRIVLCGRRDAALVACFAAAVAPSVSHVATEDLRLSFLPLFASEGEAINAASILPGLLRRFGDMPEVLTEIAPRRVLVSAGVGLLPGGIANAAVFEKRFSTNTNVLLGWVGGNS